MQVFISQRIDKSSSPKVSKIKSEPPPAVAKVQFSTAVKQLFPEVPARHLSPRAKVATETRIFQDQIRKLQAQLETSKYSEGLLRTELNVISSQRRDKLIESQCKVIDELRSELVAHKQSTSPKPEGKFLDYLEEFQAETVKTTQARLTAETEALLTKHEGPVPHISPLRNLEHLSTQYDLLE